MIFEYLVKKLSPINEAKIGKKHCIYYRNRFDRCTICKDVCKDNAIITTEDEIKIDNTKCSRCGLCKAKCPSQAINIDNFGELELLKKSKKKKCLYIGCKKTLETVDFSFNCLNGLHIEYLIAFLIINKDCEIYFNLSECKDCKLSLSDEIERKVSLVIEFLKKLNIDVKVKFVYENTSNAREEKVITRREFFQMVTGESAIIFQDFLISTAEEYYRKDNFNERKLLLDVISELKKISKDIEVNTDIFTGFQVSSNCDGCGFCEAICPYDAWRTIDTEHEFIIEHNPSKCRGCKLCSKLCSNNSIKDSYVKVSQMDNEYIEKLKKKR